MKQFENDPYLYMDNKYSQDRLKAIKARVADNRLDEEPIVRLERKASQSYVALFDNSDFHFGGQGFQYDRAKLALYIESLFFNAIMGIGGDSIDNANKRSKTNIYESRLSPSQSSDGFYDLIKDYDFSYVLGGNHGSTWGDRCDEDLSVEKEIADRIGVPYAKHSLVMYLHLLKPNGYGTKKMTVCMKHKAENIQKLIEYFLANGEIPDFIYVEHLHTGDEGAYIVELPVLDKNGIQIGVELHRIFVVVGKSMQSGKTTFAVESMFPDNGTNVKGVLISWKENVKAGKPGEPDLIPNIDPFYVLHEKETRIGIKCQMILDKYIRPDITEFKQQVDEMSLSEISEKIEDFCDNAHMELSSFVKNKNLLAESYDEEEIIYGR